MASCDQVGLPRPGHGRQIAILLSAYSGRSLPFPLYLADVQLSSSAQPPPKAPFIIQYVSFLRVDLPLQRISLATHMGQAIRSSVTTLPLDSLRMQNLREYG